MAIKKNLKPITMENVDIQYRNFAGKEGAYNKDGERNFCIFLTREDGENMKLDGWNIKERKLREGEDVPQMYLQIHMGYKFKAPKIVMLTSRGQTPLGEEELILLDYADIVKADLIINPGYYDINGKQGLKAWVKTLFVTVYEDELELKYADNPNRPADNDEL